MSDDPLDRLAAAQPIVAAPTRAATAQAREALVAHMATTALTPSIATRRPRRAWSGLVGIAAALIFGLALGILYFNQAERADVVVAASPGLPGLELGARADVELFVARLTALGASTGDATIVRRVHGGDGDQRQGVDVFTDDGRYAYGLSADAALVLLADGAGERPWPVSGDLSEALAAIAETARPTDDADRFVAAIRQSVGNVSSADPSEIGDEAWSGVLAALPLLPGSPDVAIGAVRVLDGLPDVELRDAVLDGRDVVVAVRVTSTGSERLFFDASAGSPIRYDRVSIGGEVLAQVSYDAERVELG